MSVMQVIVLYLHIESEVRRPPGSKDMASFWSRH